MTDTGSTLLHHKTEFDRWQSLTIGIYLFALGIGSYLTRFLEEDLVERFVQAGQCDTETRGLGEHEAARRFGVGRRSRSRPFPTWPRR